MTRMMMISSSVPRPMYMSPAYPDLARCHAWVLVPARHGVLGRGLRARRRAADDLAVGVDDVLEVRAHAVEAGTAVDDVLLAVAHEDPVVALVAVDGVAGRVVGA